MLCGYEVLPDTQGFGTFEKWMSEVRMVNFDRVADELLAALEDASDGEALEVLHTISEAIVPQKGTQRG